MHVDSDRETILDTLDEVEQFAAATTCAECRREALDMVEVLTGPRVLPVRVTFSTLCRHAGP